MQGLRWRSVFGVILFASLAIGLLVYDHLNRGVSSIVFWLAVGLVVAIVGRMVETLRSQSDALREELQNALRDHVTGLERRARLQEDVKEVLVRARSGSGHALVLLELDGLHTYNDRFGYAAGDDLLRLFAQNLVATIEPHEGRAYRVDGSRLAALVPIPHEQVGRVVLAATACLRELERDQIITSAYGEVMIPEEAEDSESAFKVAGQRLSAHKQRQHRSARRQAHAVLLAAYLARRPEKSEQLRTVAARAIALGRRLGAASAEIDDIALAAELHEVGLLALPDAVVSGERRPTEEEVDQLLNHTAEGEGIIGSATGLVTVARLVRGSSEHFDGGGHPDGIGGAKIPLGSRVIAVAAAYAAITSPPHPEPARSAAEAIEELRSRAGTEFDPRVVEALAEEIAEANGSTWAVAPATA